MIREEYLDLRQVVELDCGIGACPAVYETGRKTYLVVGRLVNPEDAGLRAKVGEDERLVEVPRELIDEMKR